ncbi:MAG: hypothetical protein HY964_04390 [Ignavibacteriales bacterium]|nr:hypothetical protein [Ignavibacteriales bacterium]
MKNIIIFFVFIFLINQSVFAADYKIIGVKGTVSVRHGINENWSSVSAGDVLKPEDSIELGKQSSATLMIGPSTQIILPEMVMVDMSDFRYISKEELLMKLALENIRSIPARDNNKDMNIPRVTTIHGEEKNHSGSMAQNFLQAGEKQLNGGKVLFNNGFYATCALKTKQIFRLYPSLIENMDARILLAESFEKMNLNKEALEEYAFIISKSPTADTKQILQKKIDALKKKLNE